MSFLAVAALAACSNGGDQSTADDAAAAAADSAAMPGHMMPSATMGSAAMMAQMRQHMTMMQAEHADTGQAALAMHQMGVQMLAEMEKEVQAMKLPADPRWSALLDSVRQDMAAMPGRGGGMGGRGMMSQEMSAHRDRMMRLMDMHQSRLQQHQTTSR